MLRIAQVAEQERLYTCARVWHRLKAFQGLSRVLQRTVHIVHVFGNVAEIAEALRRLLIGGIRFVRHGPQRVHRVGRFAASSQRNGMIAHQSRAQALVGCPSCQIECFVQQAFTTNVVAGRVIVDREHVQYSRAVVRVVLELGGGQRLAAGEHVADGDRFFGPCRITDQHVHEVRDRFTARCQLKSLVALQFRDTRLTKCDGDCGKHCEQRDGRHADGQLVARDKFPGRIPAAVWTGEYRASVKIPLNVLGEGVHRGVALGGPFLQPLERDGVKVAGQQRGQLLRRCAAARRGRCVWRALTRTLRFISDDGIFQRAARSAFRFIGQLSSQQLEQQDS